MYVCTYKNVYIRTWKTVVTTSCLLRGESGEVYFHLSRFDYCIDSRVRGWVSSLLRKHEFIGLLISWRQLCGVGTGFYLTPFFFFFYRVIVFWFSGYSRYLLFIIYNSSFTFYLNELLVELTTDRSFSVCRAWKSFINEYSPSVIYQISCVRSTNLNLKSF